MSGVLRYLTGQSDHYMDISDFIEFKKNGRIGFPKEPMCSGYDAQLGLYFIGTRDGHIHAIGGGNVHYIAILPEPRDPRTKKRWPVRLHAVPGTGSAMIVTSDNNVFRFRIEGSTTAFDSVDLEGFNRVITSTQLLPTTSTSTPRLLLGTPVGILFAVDSKTLVLEEVLPYVSAASETRETSQNNTVQIQAIACHSNGKHIAILYSDHRIVIHDASINETMTMIDLGDVKPTTISFGTNDVLLIPFEDGTFRELPLLHGDLSRPMQVFGPYPCNPVDKMTYAICSRNAVPVLVFSGGMPTASYGDHHTITLKTERSLLVLDFASKVVDFHVSKAFSHDDTDPYMYDSVLIALTEHEIVLVDLRDNMWRTLPYPQYFPMDSHHLTSAHYAANIAPEVWSKMIKLSDDWWRRQNQSNAPNPFFAYTQDKLERSTTDEHHKRQLLLTGHEDGTVNVFTCGEKSSRLLFQVQVHQEFELVRDRERTVSAGSSSGTTISSDDDADKDEPGCMVDNTTNEEEWPPFRKVGIYDQFVDEPGVAVVKMVMDPTSGHFAVSTKCGVNLVYELSETSQTLTPGLQSLNLVDDFTVKARVNGDPSNRRDPDRPLPPRIKEKTYLPGFQPCHVQESTTSVFIQLDPRTPCTTMAILSSRNMVALANEFGFVIFNYAVADVLLKNSYISSEDLMSAVGENMRSLYKSMKKSVRKTFRRKKRDTPNKNLIALNDTLKDGICLGDEDAEDDGDFRPIERQVEGRNLACPVKVKPHLVRTVCFLRTPLSDGSDLTDTFWVGLNCSHVFGYAIEERPREKDVLRLDKEIRLAHSAPVIYMGVFMEISNKPPEFEENFELLDKLSCFTAGKAVAMSKSILKRFEDDCHAHHRLLIVTEEQIRLYSLPSLKQLKYKVKLTSTEGLHIRKVGVAVVHSATKPLTRAPWIVILTNTGEARIYSTQNAKMKYRYQVINEHNHIAINSTLMSPFGDLLYLRPQQTEFQKATISSHSIKWREPFQDTQWPLSMDAPEEEST